MIVIFSLCIGFFNCTEVHRYESKPNDVGSILAASEECQKNRTSLIEAGLLASCVRSMK